MRSSGCVDGASDCVCMCVCVRVLLSLKASQVQVDAVDEDGWTPLHASVYWGNFEAAELLVTHGASIDKKTNTVREGESRLNVVFL